MKKLVAVVVLALCASFVKVEAQSADYRAFYVHFSRHYTDFTPLNTDIDSMNAHGASYSKVFGHFTYGIGFVRKHRFIETGFNFYWGNTKEIVSGTSDSVGNIIEFTDYWVRQRLFSASYRIGLSMGNHFSIGTDLGGVLSNFQHLKLEHTKTPLWFLNYSGQRSFLGSVSPYLSIHVVLEESIYLNLEPYAAFTFGDTHYDEAFDKQIFYPNSSINGKLQMRFYGLRIGIGLGSVN